MSVETEYLNVIRKRFGSIKKLGDQAISQLSEKDIHWKPSEESNSIAIIVKHLSGNMVSRWTDFLTSDGEKSYRNRDEEFQDTIQSKQELAVIWEEGWDVLFGTLTDLVERDLLNEIQIRSEKHTVIDAVERQLAHYAYHIGQIVYIGKQLKDADWESLSIPKGKSTEYLDEMRKKHT